MVSELSDFLLHRCVHEIEISHELAVAGLIDDAFQKATHEAGVLGHGVRLLRAFTKLCSQCDGHDQPVVERFLDLIRRYPTSGRLSCEGLRGSLIRCAR